MEGRLACNRSGAIIDVILSRRSALLEAGRAIAQLEWYILDILSDDRECPATICPEVPGELSETSRQQILETLTTLADAQLLA
jgi:hypothetical protein